MIVDKIRDAIDKKAPLTVFRSKKWPGVRKKFLKSNPTCACCGGQSNLNVHHIKPFHLFPELELEPTNLITLCETNSRGINCHLLLGHLGNYKNINPYIHQDIKTWNKRYKSKKCLL